MNRTVTILALLLCAGAAFAQETIDEAALFADTNTVVDSAATVSSAADLVVAQDKPSIGFSGDVQTAGTLSGTRRWFTSGTHLVDTRFDGYIVGNLLLDARLIQGIKAFANGELSYAPGADTVGFHIRELFVDANIKHHAYFRTGKQVLQWGRCYFFNPTDLVNVEKKSFTQKLSAREGATGVKLHVPFGTKANVYGFLDVRKVTRIDSVAGALKFEWLLKGTEMALAVWDRKGRKPVYGFDISTKLLGIDISGEAALYQRLYSGSLAFDAPIRDIPADGTSVPDTSAQSGPAAKPRVVTVKSDHPVPRVAIGLSRSFNVLGVPDRVTAVAEFYYNGAGNTNRTIKIPGVDTISTEIVMLALASGIYEQNNYSKAYLALFTTVSKFIVSDMTLQLNAMVNLNQRCAMIAGGLTYQTLSNFSLGLNVTGFVGPEHTEYTELGTAAQVMLTAGVSF